MADIDHFDDGYGAEAAHGAAQAGSRLGVLVNWAGALMSLGLVIGMSVWAFQLTVRDVSGVPVIEAIEGPMRQPPADPGGTQAPHQGLAVNRIAEGEEAQPVPDRLVLAPPPIELQEVAFETEMPAPTPRPAVATAAVEGEIDAAPAPTDPAEARAETQALIDRLLQEAQSGVAPPPPAEAAPAPEAPVPEAVADSAPDPAADGDETAPGVIPDPASGIVRSLRPAVRPASFPVQGEEVQTSSTTSGRTREIPSDDLPDGTRLVQLGAFDTADIARAEWDRIAARFPDYFEDRPRVIEEAASGGQMFFRLRAAGFDDLAGSRRFCAVLVAQGAACIPVTVR